MLYKTVIKCYPDKIKFAIIVTDTVVITFKFTILFHFDTLYAVLAYRIQVKAFVNTALLLNTPGTSSTLSLFPKSSLLCLLYTSRCV